MRNKVFIIILFSLIYSVNGQNIRDKVCKICGKPLSVCIYRGRHPMNDQNSMEITDASAPGASISNSTPQRPQETYSFSVNSSPDGCSVFIDGIYKGMTPIKANETKGKHSMRIEKNGYSPKEFDLIIGDNPIISIELECAAEKGIVNGHECVDLGLSIRWATCNIGATSERKYGSFFAFGKPDNMTAYNPSNYRRPNQVTQMNDAATVNWGYPWRSPTQYEFSELINSCTWRWDGSGYLITSKKNGNSIYLPAAGWMRSNPNLYREAIGCYWSSSPYDSGAAYHLYFSKDRFSLYNLGTSSEGMSIRPVTQ